MRRRGLPSRAFLGEMVVGHKNSKVMKPFYEQIIRTFAKIADTVGKRMCKNVLYKVFVNTFYFFRKWSFLANCENIRWNRIIAELFVFQ